MILSRYQHPVSSNSEGRELVEDNLILTNTYVRSSRRNRLRVDLEAELGERGSDSPDMVKKKDDRDENEDHEKGERMSIGSMLEVKINLAAADDEETVTVL